MTVRRAMAYVGVAALVCVPITWLTRAVIDARERAHSSQCVGNLSQIGLGLLNYEYVYGCFPPAYVADAKGKPLYSWRVLILPFMERDDLYQKIHLNEPWDSPNNRKLHELVAVGKMPISRGKQVENC